MPPERANLVLASNIPDSERDVLVLDSLDIEACEYKISLRTLPNAEEHTDCWNGSHDLAELELVQDGGLTSGIETDLCRVELF